MRIGISNGKTHPAIVAEAASWFIEFRAGDVHGEARLRFIEWLRRSPEHIQAYLEVSGVWAELPSSDPEGRIDIASLIARARSEPDVIALSPGTCCLACPSPGRGGFAAALAARRASGHGGCRAARRRHRAALASAAITGGSYSTGIGEQRTVQLVDGSTVELNARSTIQVRLTEHERDADAGRRPGILSRREG